MQDDLSIQLSLLILFYPSVSERVLELEVYPFVFFYLFIMFSGALNNYQTNKDFRAYWADFGYPLGAMLHLSRATDTCVVQTTNKILLKNQKTVTQKIRLCPNLFLVSIFRNSKQKHQISNSNETLWIRPVNVKRPKSISNTNLFFESWFLCFRKGFYLSLGPQHPERLH